VLERVLQFYLNRRAIHLKKLSFKDLEPELFPLEGGVVWLSNDQIILTPQCCVSLEDYQEWLEVTPSATLKRIWIGHPWIYYQTDDQHIYFSRLTEKSFEDTWRYYALSEKATLSGNTTYEETTEREVGEHLIQYAVDYAVFEKAQKGLYREIAAFHQRITGIFQQMGLDKPEKAASCLINGNGRFPSYDKETLEE
jgi:hypothetical protein